MEATAAHPNMVDMADNLLRLAFAASGNVEDVDVIVRMSGQVFMYIKFNSATFQEGIARQIEAAAKGVIPAGTSLVVTIL